MFLNNFGDFIHVKKRGRFISVTKRTLIENGINVLIDSTNPENPFIMY